MQKMQHKKFSTWRSCSFFILTTAPSSSAFCLSTWAQRSTEQRNTQPLQYLQSHLQPGAPLQLQLKPVVHRLKINLQIRTKVNQQTF